MAELRRDYAEREERTRVWNIEQEALHLTRPNNPGKGKGTGPHTPATPIGDGQAIAKAPPSKPLAGFVPSSGTEDNPK
eukprot:4795773-Heterocapsa_arctica.AAC.1